MINDTWIRNYEIAKEYYLEHGDLNVPSKTKLYSWISAQKYAYRGKRGNISKEQISLLESIGIEWKSQRDKKWQWYYEHAKEYYLIHNQLNIPSSFVAEDGCKIGAWITRQRKAYRYKAENLTMKHKPLITDEEILLLEDIGMIWDVTWLGRAVSIPEIIVYYYIKKFFSDAIKLSQADFLKCEIDIYIPSKKIGIEYDGQTWHKNKKNEDEKKGLLCKRNDIKLLRIRENELPKIKNCEKSYFVKARDYKGLGDVIEEIIYDISGKEYKCNLSDDMGNIIEMHNNYNDHRWDYVYSILLKKYSKYGYVNIKTNDATKEGINLYQWISKQRELYKEGLLTKEHEGKLLALMINLKPHEDAWNEWIKLLEEYKNTYGNINVPIEYKTDDGKALGKLIAHVREKYRNGSLDNEKKKILNEMNITWNPLKEDEKNKRKLLIEYYEKYGTVNMPMYTRYQDVPLWEWLQGKKKKYRKGQLSQDDIHFFEKYNIIWNVHDKKWEIGFLAAKEFYEENGNLFVPLNYISNNGIKLANWLYRQRDRKRKGNMKEEQIKKLKSIGMCWDPFDYNWKENYWHLKKYHELYGNIDLPTDYIYEDIKLGMWLSTQRQAYRGNPNYKITEERIRLLEELGMDWKGKIKSDSK